jgi:hypothetical protein
VTRERRRHAPDATSLSSNRPFIRSAERTALRSLPTAVLIILAGDETGVRRRSDRHRAGGRALQRGRLAALTGLMVVASMLVLGAPARAEAPAVDSVVIDGEAVVGATLSVTVEVSGDPAPVVELEWRLCDPAKPSRCIVIAGADSSTYVPVVADEGLSLRVRATASNSDGADSKRSAPTDPVQPAPAAEDDPDPEPPPEPTPQPFPPDVPPPPPATGSPATAALRYLRPFPVVRIRGLVARRGAHVTLLRVTAPRRAWVKIRCRGSRCPVKRRTQRPGRVRPFERYLPAGLRIVIRVRRHGLVGKYVRLTVRAGKPPARRDACLLPGSRRPVACPPA